VNRSDPLEAAWMLGCGCSVNGGWLYHWYRSRATKNVRVTA
jgi:hypothetical protein